MMTEHMKALVASVERLSPEAQDKIAEQIGSAIDNALWDAHLRDPERLAILRALAEEAMNDPALPFPTPVGMGKDAQDPERAE